MCECCGKPLDPATAREVSSLYTIDFRGVCHVTKHVSYECQCGLTTHACLTEGMRHGVGYSPRVEALAAYLLHGQCAPVARVRLILSDVFGLNLSQGTIQNMVKSMGEKAGLPYEVIRQEIENSPVVGADETGAAVQSGNR